MASSPIDLNASILPMDNPRHNLSNPFDEKDLSTLSTLIPTGIGLYILSLTTFVGNAMVLHAIRTEKRLQTVSNMFIMSLASADLTVGLIVMPISSAYALTGDWKFGYVVCQFWLVLDYTASTASIFNLCILSLDRYWSISTPLQYLRKRTKKRALIMIALAWLASAMWFIPVLGWHHILYDGKRQQPEGVCDTEFATNMTFKVVTSILNFYIPVTLMIVINVRIFLAIKRRSEDIERLGATTSAISASTAQITTNNGTSVHEDIACDSLTEHDHMDSEYCQDRQKSFLPKRKRKKKRQKHHTCTKSNNSSMKRNLSHDHFNHSSVVEFHKLAIMTVKTKTSQQKSSCNNTNNNNQVGGSQHRDSDILTVYEGVTVNVEYVNNRSQNDDLQKGKQIDKLTNTCNSSKSDHSNHRQCYRSSRKCLPPCSKNGNGNNNNNATNGNNGSSNSISMNGVSQVPSRSYSDVTIEKEADDQVQTSSLKVSSDWLGALCCCHKDGARGNQGSDIIFAPPIPSSNLTATNPKTVLAKEKKAATQLGVIVGAFILCWLPYFTLFMVVAYCGEGNQCVSSTVHTVTIWFGYFNSTLNPILYPLCNRNFKRAFKRMLRLSSSSGVATQNNHHLSYLYQK